MTLDKYKCEYCKHIEDNVFKCTDNHLVCEKCAIQFKKLCKCKKMLPNNKQTNPIDLLVKYETKACHYSSIGCTLQITCEELVNHVTECKYRPYRCIGEIFGLWTCEWTGRQLDLPLHMNTAHGESLGDNFEFFQKSSVSFNPTESWHSLNIVKGYGKHFVYYMYSDSAKKLIYFIIYLLGLKEEAQNYVIIFEIISKTSSFEKVFTNDMHDSTDIFIIKFISLCYNDTENIQEIIESEKCAVLTHNTLKNFVSDGEIHFRFIIKRKDDDEFIKKPLVDAKIKVVSPPTKPVANFSFKDKGKAKTNTVKKSGTTPSIIQPVLKPLQTDSVSQISQVTTTTTPTSQTSSINARPDRSSTSPCHSPSINKDEECDIRRSDILKRSFSASPCSSSLPPVQPYKNIDDKMFRRRYPENCLTKPAFKK